MCTKKIVIEPTRDLIYIKFVATDFFPKIISPSAGEKSGDLVKQLRWKLNFSTSLLQRFTAEFSQELRRNAVP